MNGSGGTSSEQHMVDIFCTTTEQQHLTGRVEGGEK